jgi:hypothetical protein
MRQIGRSIKLTNNPVQQKYRSPDNMPQKAQTGIRGITLLILNLGARWGWVVNATSRPLYLRERVPVPTAEEAWWAPRAVWTSKEKRKSLAPTGV